ncbi:lysyl-tRNA synthetase class 2 [Microbacterium resistens]|uniref:Lysine--tRNA ligase n=1 Tax=Microbacterium resistens TaxID=156977 RepID=A0ABU1SBX5_9MICO|nr:bifunctional lysylphosphatidylglycerol synthetase/lysine--tRNA ligase LysX [Microbacterium resistens]MDR6867066.1 lysyl-tRNA synthetase class 2 [Microbacterium resistens]
MTTAIAQHPAERRQREQAAGRVLPRRLLSGVPLWTGRILQVVAITLVVSVLWDAVLPDGVYWAASYFAVYGLTPQPFLFNAVLLFIAGSAAKRRIRGALIFLVLFELPTILLPVANVVLGGGTIPAPETIEDLVAALIAAALVTLLLVARREFSARLERVSYLKAAAVLVGGLVFAVLVGGVLARLHPGDADAGAESWMWAFTAAIGIYPSWWMIHGEGAVLHPVVALLVTSIAAVSLLAALTMILRSARARRLLSATDELHVRRILAGSRTDDSLGYFATRRDKSVVFSPDGTSAVSYRVVGGVALASGDPLGPERAWSGATGAFLDLARTRGWRPAVLAATEQGAEHYARQGMRGLLLGDEAVLHVDDARARLLLRSPQIAAVRRRAARAGVTVRLRRQRDCDEAELREIAALADRWRADDEERGYSMALSRTGDPADPSSLIATAHGRDGETVALLVFVPWNADGLSLDLMRRSPDAVNGVVEHLVATLVSEAKAFGVRRISLNFAVFRDILVRGARVGAGPLLRVKRSALLLLSRKWQLDSLRRANEKYAPEWRRRYLMRDRGTSFGAVVLAAARAEKFIGGWPRAARPPVTLRSDAYPQLVAELEAEAASEAASAAAAVAASGSASRPGSCRSARTLRAAMLAERGVALYPPHAPRTHGVEETIADLRAAVGAAHAAPAGHAVHAAPAVLDVRSVAGRVVARRHHGGIVFVDIVEEHARIQLIATREDTADFALLRLLQLGDLVSATGTPGRSRAGEPSIAVASWTLAAKSLQQPPDKRAGLRDPEAQVRLRHVHLATAPKAAALLRARSLAVRALREGLQADGYLEVETPILQRVHGGANARPFATHINAYDRDLSLRIAPELALKRLVVGGFGRVFEIGRNFRNEGVDATHNPEFTAMEAYRAYADYDDMRVLAEGLVKRMAVAVTGEATMIAPDGSRVDVSAPWRAIPVCEALSERIGTHIGVDLGVDGLGEIARAYGVRVAPSDTAGAIVEALYEELVEPNTTLPTFYLDFPSDTSPLARPHRRVDGLSERWDLVAFGMELGTAYSELNDPVEQRRRLVAQSLQAALGDPEAMEVDEDFLRALEYGMPPTGGIGLGIDRIVMSLTGGTIRQTLAFPFVR